jgi:hypothetical protein
MADRDPVWSLGESSLLYSPTSDLDMTWSLGESWSLDQYEAPAPPGGSGGPIWDGAITHGVITEGFIVR